MGVLAAERNLLHRALILSLLVHVVAGASLPRVVPAPSAPPLAGIIQVISMPRMKDETTKEIGTPPPKSAPVVALTTYGHIPAPALPARTTPSLPALPVRHSAEDTTAQVTAQPVHTVQAAPGVTAQPVSMPLPGSGGQSNADQSGDDSPATRQDNRSAGGAETHGSMTRAAAASVGSDDTPHPLTYGVNPPPAYPAAARRRGIQGDVLLEVLVDEAGQPVRVSLKQGSGHASLDQAAMRAVQDWRFQPARRGGQPIIALALVPVRYRLTE